IKARKNGHPVCSGCGERGSTYDHQREARYFEFIPLWGIVVYLRYVMRRVNCSHCGVKVELVPWCQGKNQLTVAYQLFLARWAQRLSWKEVAEVFSTTWDKVFKAVTYVVDYGLKHRDLSNLQIEKLATSDVETFLIVKGVQNNRASMQHIVAYLRCFLRFLNSQDFLHAEKDIHIDTPRLYRQEKLPRSLPWETVLALLQSIDLTQPNGLRDYAIPKAFEI
ncbi:transposase family protein, partial [Sedimenticola sp.]|uniref:transposase family protein n=1 Tax=Sedimenticola sp. TaxID=1940285 RepID=UPI003D118045